MCCIPTLHVAASTASALSCPFYGCHPAHRQQQHGTMSCASAALWLWQPACFCKHFSLRHCCQVKRQSAEWLDVAVMLMLPAAIRRNENLVQQVQQVDRLQQQNSQLQQTVCALRQQLNKETIRHQQQARAAGQHGRGFAEMQLRHGDAQQQVRSCAPHVAAAKCAASGGVPGAMSLIMG